MQPNAQSLHKTSLHLIQDSQLNNSFTLAVLLGAAVPHLERGTVALRVALPHLSNRWEAGGYLYFSLSSITSLSSFPTVQTDENQQVLIFSLSLLHWCPSSSQAFPLTSPSILEKKKVSKVIREQLHRFPKPKEHLVHVLAGGCVCYS